VNWNDGFSEAQFASAFKAQEDAADYHALTVREAATDRAWAERLSAKLQ